MIRICTLAAVDSVKRKLVPSGAFLAEIAVLGLATRKRRFVSFAPEIAGRGVEDCPAGGTAAGAIATDPAVLAGLPSASALLSAT